MKQHAREIERTRASAAFDAEWYRQEHPDVDLSGLPPEAHFVRFGVEFGRRPSHGFDRARYEREFPEAVGVNPVLHFEEIGRHMGFDPVTGTFPHDDFAGPGATCADAAYPPLVSVVMTAFNASATVERAVRSLLAQTLRNIEIVVVDDRSSDGTAEVVAALSREDGRVRLLRLAANRGTYWAKNLGLHHARAPVVALSDSDDVSHPDRLARQYKALMADPRRLVCYANYRRVTPDGTVVPNRGVEHRLGFITLMARKRLFDIVGFYDSVRVAADNEFHGRMVRLLGKAAIHHLAEPVYDALVRADSLSALDKVDLGVEPAPDRPAGDLSHLSPARQDYVRGYTAWHESGQDLRISFPLRERPFPAPAIAVQAMAGSERITASVASFPARRTGLERVVAAVLPQVDRLRVHLNGFESLPAFLRDPRISVTRSQVHGDLRDNGKFLRVDEVEEGIHVTLDDDIHYPRNYVAFLAAKVLQYDRKAVVGLHASVLQDDFQRYHDGRSRWTGTFRQELGADRLVHVLGTGTVAYHTSAIRFDLEDVTSTGMIDLWLAKAAQEQGVPMIALARGRHWLRPMEEFRQGSIYEQGRHDDSRETDFVLAHGPWRLIDDVVPVP